MKIGICVPTYSNITREFFESMMQLDIPCEWELYTFTDINVAHARNILVKEAMMGQCDFIFFTDPDMVIPEHAIMSLLEDYNKHMGHNLVFSGLYYNRWPPHNAHAYKLLQTGKFVGVEVEEETFKVDGVGMGCALINMRAFQMIDYPWFELGQEGGTEDLVFCKKCKDKNIGIYCNPEVLCGHVGKIIVKGQMIPTGEVEIKRIG